MAYVKFASQPHKHDSEDAPLLSTHGSERDYEETNEREDEIVDDFKESRSESRRTLRNGVSLGKGFLPRSTLGEHHDILPLHRSAHNDVEAQFGKWVVAFLALIATFACAVGVVFIVNTIRQPLGHTGSLRNPAYLIEASHGAAATENELCSVIGVEVMKEGGNAVDAAIASTFCIGVVSLFSSGIGGGGFMTVRIPPKSPNSPSEVWTINFREKAPALANESMYLHDSMASKFGGLAVGVPGEVKGLAEAHRRWGSLPWKRLVQPSVELAAGWTVGKELGRRLQFPFFEPLMLTNPDWSQIFAPNGRILKEGDVVRRTNYSQTLAAIALHGGDAFYKGPIADSLVKKVKATGGILTQEDLASYTVDVQPALSGTYLGRKVYVPHAPTSGPVMLHMLNLLEQYNLTGEGRTGLNTHRIVEVMKFGFAARTKICDPKFTNDTIRIDEISTKDFSKVIAANITDNTTHPPEYYNPIYDAPMDHGTSHVSTVDKNGMATSITSTVNLVFGSQVMDPVTGVLLNDEMDDFSTPGQPNAFGLWPSPFNYPEPGKQPLSSTVPTIMEHEDGSFYMTSGGSGGSLIFGAVLQVILGIDRWGMDVSQAIEYGRVHDQLYPLNVAVDDILPEESVQALISRGHNVTVEPIDRIAAVVQAIVKIGDKVYAASDSRKNGIAAGY